SDLLGQKARDNKLTPDEMTGSTFSISNLGMYAIDGFTPIINPPETAILGVGRIVDKPVVVDGEVEVRPMMVLSLSFDHRAIDGAPAASFLTDLKERLENPYGLLIQGVKTMKSYNLAIIGAGPGGYVATIRAAKEGLRVALVSGGDLGGTCLNRGCIPSKTMLKHAEVIEEIKGAKTYGITVNDFSFSIKDMVSRKTKVVKTLQNGIKSLMKQNKIDVFDGMGTVKEDKTVTIASASGSETIQADNVMLANGSKPLVPGLPGIDEIDYYTSDTIFDIEEVPGHLVIMGGGVIGLEIACIFNSLDTEVEIVEMADRIIPTE